jgi:hypothetical protein
LPVELDDKGRTSVPLGRTDVCLRRADGGHGLSERIERLRIDADVHYLGNTARRSLEKSLTEQLFLNKAVPRITENSFDPAVLRYLAIYAKLHAGSDVILALPNVNSWAKGWLWRFDADKGELVRIAANGTPTDSVDG